VTAQPGSLPSAVLAPTAAPPRASTGRRARRLRAVALNGAGVLVAAVSSDWGAIMAASTLYTIPPILFFLLVQRRMARGLVAGAVKG
jgi:ABC-type glycerol-3-phosphate transport system permease component